MAIDPARIGKIHVGLLGAAGCIGYATHSVEPRSLLLGGALMGINFWLLGFIGNILRTGLFDLAKRGRVALAVAAMTLKFALFLGLLLAVFWGIPIAGMSFALGVTLLLVACLCEAARAELRQV
jgi:hypothetical protein